MQSRSLLIVLLIASVCLTPLTVAAQESATAPAVVAAANVVPNLINYNGVLKDSIGRTLRSMTGVTFLLYKDEQGGAPLWLETQNVTPDKTGHYSVHLGAATKNGIPTDLFMNGEARWLAVQISNEPEQLRVLLVAVPYALKAADADTLGGKPISAFVTKNSQTSFAQVPTNTAATNQTAAKVGGSGTTNFIPIWTNSTTLGNSVLFQTGGNVGLATTTPKQKFEVDSGNLLVRGPQNFKGAGNTAFLYVGDTQHPIEAIWNTGLAIGTYKVPEALFIQDKTGNVGIGTTTPSLNNSRSY